MFDLLENACHEQIMKRLINASEKLDLTVECRRRRCNLGGGELRLAGGGEGRDLRAVSVGLKNKWKCNLYV